MNGVGDKLTDGALTTAIGHQASPWRAEPVLQSARYFRYLAFEYCKSKSINPQRTARPNR
jgi:hypothetical protein